MNIINFVGLMTPGFDGVSCFVYRMREAYKKTSDKHFYVSPILPDPLSEDLMRVPSFKFPLYPAYRVSTIRSQTLISLVQHRTFDLVHLHTPCPLGQSGLHFAKKKKIPVIATYHTHFPTYTPYYRMGFLTPIIWKYIVHFYNQCDQVIVSSPTILEELKEKGIKRLTLIPSGVDLKDFDETKRSQKWRDSILGSNRTNGVIFLFVGRLVWEKNLGFLIRVWEELKEKELAKLVFVGDGPARKKLEKKLPHAHFTGYLRGDELSTAYASSDVFIFPSVSETFGSVTLEALSSGLPAIVAQSSAGSDMIIEGKNGWTVDVSSTLPMVQLIKKIINTKESLYEMKKYAKTSVQKFSWDKTIQSYYDNYHTFAKRT